MINTPPSIIDRTNRQKINEKTEDLNNRINQLDLTNIYKTLHPKTAEYTIFLSAYLNILCLDHILGHKTSNRLNYVTSKFTYWSSNPQYT